jgi:hypothetical protein
MVETTELEKKAIKPDEFECDLPGGEVDEPAGEAAGISLENNDSDISDENTEEELARPALTIKEASSLLGRSVRALERSILGRWGNKLPDGWIAKKINIDGNNEWRIIPPDSFKVRHRSRDEETGREPEGDDLIPNLLEEALNLALPQKPKETFVVKHGEDGLDSSTIIIDRSEEVEQLLKELVKVHKALADETRQHVEDLRMLNEMTNSMRLLETNQHNNQMLKEELLNAQRELVSFKHQYEAYLNLPWWKRLFRSFP